MSVAFDSVFDMEEQVTPLTGQPVLGTLAAVGASVASLDDAPVYGLVDADLEAAIEACQSAQARLFGVLLALARDADERDLGRRSGAASTAAWLAGRYRIRPGQARSLVRLANQSRPDPGPVDYAANVRSATTGRELRATAAALAEGTISPEHVAVVGKVLDRIPQAISVVEAQQAEAELAGFCRQHDPGVVAKLGDYLLALMAVDTLDDAENERERRRQLRLNEATGGISGCLTSEGMAILRTALDPLAAPNPSSDGQRDPRTPGQRLIDALVELARRAIATDSFETNHGISHRVLVTIGLETLTAGHAHNGDGSASHSDADNSTVASRTVGGDGAALPHLGTRLRVAPGEVQWGGLISPSAARRIACCAGIQRVILDPTGAVLDVGREYRTATPAQFAALIARDGGCAFPGCTRPASWCIAHHIIHWADGGPTDLDNLVLLCTQHHTLVHHGGWDIRVRQDRLPEFIPPPWVDPDRTPRRNNRPRYGLATTAPHR